MGYYQEILKYAFQEPPSAASGITFVKAESVSLFQDLGDGITSYTVTGIQSGDFILGFASDSAGGVPARPTGTTSIYGYNGLHNSTAFRAFSTGTSITFNSMDDEALYSFVVFRGVNSTTPLDVSITAPSTDSGNVTTITPPSITPVTNGCMIVLFLTIEDEAALVGNVTFDSSYTNGEEVYKSSPDSYNLAVYKTQATAAAESPSAFTWTGADNAHTTTIALRPA